MTEKERKQIEKGRLSYVTIKKREEHAAALRRLKLKAMARPKAKD